MRLIEYPLMAREHTACKYVCMYVCMFVIMKINFHGNTLIFYIHSICMYIFYLKVDII